MKFFILINIRLIHRGKIVLFFQTLKIVHVEVSSHEQLSEMELLPILRLKTLKVITHYLESCLYAQLAICSSYSQIKISN